MTVLPPMPRVPLEVKRKGAVRAAAGNQVQEVSGLHREEHLRLERGGYKVPESMQEAASPSAVMLVMMVPVPKLNADGLGTWETGYADCVTAPQRSPARGKPRGHGTLRA